MCVQFAETELREDVLDVVVRHAAVRKVERSSNALAGPSSATSTATSDSLVRVGHPRLDHRAAVDPAQEVGHAEPQRDRPGVDEQRSCGLHVAGSAACEQHHSRGLDVSVHREAGRARRTSDIAPHHGQNHARAASHCSGAAFTDAEPELVAPRYVTMPPPVPTWRPRYGRGPPATPAGTYAYTDTDGQHQCEPRTSARSVPAVGPIPPQDSSGCMRPEHGRGRRVLRRSAPSPAAASRRGREAPARGQCSV